MGKIGFTEQGWEEYLFWQAQDKRTVKKINDLLKDISRNGPLEGIGKPEALKGDLAGCYSRRIDGRNRLVYCFSTSGEIEVRQCKSHYND